jgi:hypothetical protein
MCNKVFRVPMELLERGHFFQCLVENKERKKERKKEENCFVWTPRLFFQSNGVAGFGGLNLVFCYVE